MPPLRRTLPDLKRFASGIQEVTVYGDELVESTMARIVNIAGVSGEALKRATIELDYEKYPSKLVLECRAVLAAAGRGA